MRAWLVAAILMAGCAGDVGTEEPEAFRGLDAGDKGLIRGVVVDQAIQPVAEARVVVAPAGIETMTDKDGAFAFTGLEPGVYFLTASAPYHSTVQTSVDVQAGVDKPPIVRMAIEALPVPTPAIQEFQYRFVTSASGWVGGVGGIVFSDLVGDGHYAHTFELGNNVSWVQAELIWEPQQPLAGNMRLAGNLDDGTKSASAVVMGPSPLLMAFHEPPSLEALDFGTTIFIHNGELPAGVAINQDAELIVHSFQHFIPDEGWRFTTDGAHAVPPAP